MVIRFNNLMWERDLFVVSYNLLFNSLKKKKGKRSTLGFYIFRMMDSLHSSNVAYSYPTNDFLTGGA